MVLKICFNCCMVAFLLLKTCLGTNIYIYDSFSFVQLKEKDCSQNDSLRENPYEKAVLNTMLPFKKASIAKDAMQKCLLMGLWELKWVTDPW